MNQSALEENSTWTANTATAQAQILQVWRESNDAPGMYLKKLRELHQRTAKDMATELGVSLHQFNALEADNTAELPAPIYVKNYVKRYCVCLGISESEFSFVLEGMSKNVLPTLNRVSFQEKTDTRQVIVRWAGYILIAFVVIILAYGVQSLNLMGLWESVTSSSAVVESTATELSLPTIAEDPVKQDK